MQIALDKDNDNLRQLQQRYGIVGNSPALLSALERALKVAPIDLTVLVTGESGTGKEFFPQIIHNNSPRKHARYIAVNCGAIPEGTIDSELFGHEKGSFTGAVASRKGYFEEADGGTVFLDEVAELPLTTQARLLRVLETGEFLKVGSSTVQRTNIRVVAATNVDLPAAVAKGTFREDLFYRLSTVGISIPPLRDRGTDIMLLTRKFAAGFSDKYHTSGVTFDESARNELMRYPWPGNVRQLKNIIEQISLFEAGRKITAEIADKYLPPITTMLPALPSQKGTHSYDQERDMLFSIILGLRRQVDELRQEIMGGKEQEEKEFPHSSGKLVKFSDFTDTISEHQSRCGINSSENNIDLQANESCEGEPLSESCTDVSLEDTEKKAIARALAQCGGNRKTAAAALGISERTIYRKIKEYGLES